MKQNFYEKTNWLWKFLNPAVQPQLIKDYLKKESRYLLKHIKRNSTLIDIGCGFGRHLKLLAPIINSGVGIDIDKKRIKESKMLLKNYKHIKTFLKNATNFKKLPDSSFDYVICTNNTLGNLYEKKLPALKMMRRVLKSSGKIIISIHSLKAAPNKVKWYQNTGLTDIKVRKNHIYTKQGFKSEQFTKKTLKKLFKKAGLKGKIKSLNPISYICILSRV